MSTPVPPGHVPLTEGMRAVAATLVLLTHLTFWAFGQSNAWWHTVFLRGDLGVSLFFALSGLLLTRMWTRRRLAGQPDPGVGRYYRHRLTRILPAYYVALVAVLVTVGRDTPVPQILANVFFLQVYTGGYLPAFAQTWSLATEMAFYAVLPLPALWLASRRSRRAALLGCAGVALAALIATALVAASPVGAVRTLLSNSLLTYGSWFAAGMALAVLEPRLRTGSARWQRPGLWLLVLAGLFAVILTPLGGNIGLAPMPAWQAVSKSALYGVFGFVAIGMLLLPRMPRNPVGRFLGSPPMVWFGRISYSFFLWQMLVIMGVRELLGYAPFTGHFWTVAAIAFPANLAVGYVSWRLVERPFLARGVAHSPVGKASSWDTAQRPETTRGGHA